MSQEQQILEHLKAGHALTPIEALHKFGCMRLAARVNGLRQQGHAIHCEKVEQGGKRFARYSMTRRA